MLVMVDRVYGWQYETKNVRHVRTADGARKYGEPIGSPIVPHPNADAHLTGLGAGGHTDHVTNETHTPALTFTTHGKGTYSARLNERETANIIKDGRVFNVTVIEEHDGTHTVRERETWPTLKGAKAYVSAYAAIKPGTSLRGATALDAGYAAEDA